jgi:hypothetical protein
MQQFERVAESTETAESLRTEPIVALSDDELAQACGGTAAGPNNNWFSSGPNNNW